MKRFNAVLTYAGTPPLLTFSSNDGTPIVIDTTTSTAYYNNAGTVTAIGGGGGGGGTVTHTTGPLTAHSVILGNGTADVKAGPVLTDGQIVVGATGADPTGKTMSGDATLAATGALSFDLTKVHNWTVTQNVAQQSLTDALTITPSRNLSNQMYLLTTTGLGSNSRTINLPSGLQQGDLFSIQVQQPSSGAAQTIVWAAGYGWGSGGAFSAPVMTTTNGQSEYFSFIALQGGTSARGVMVGQSGATGSGYLATSTTSNTIASSGSFTFTTQAGLAYSAGCRVRVTSAASGAYIEGLCTSYTFNSLVMTADTSSGSGTHTDWTLNVAGNPGTTGAQGVPGPAGSGSGVNLQTGTTYTYLTSDASKLVSHSNAASIAATLPQATGSFGSPFVFDVENRGAGTLTITPTTSTIDGATSLALTTNQGCTIYSDGTNWYTQRGIGGAAGSSGAFFDVTNNATQTLTSGTITKVLFQTVNTDTASGWSTTNNRYTIPTAGVWQFCATVRNNGSVTSTSFLTLEKNSSVVRRGTGVFGGTVQWLTLSLTVKCAVSDLIELFATVTGTASLDFGTADTGFTGTFLHA